MLAKPVVFVVTPGTRDANNGNWRTAARWAGMLRDRCQVIVQTQWRGERADLLVALHAHRSAASIAAFRSKGDAPIAVVLSGTDLYRDLGHEADAARSLDTADRIVVLQDDAPRLLARDWRRKTEVIFQSAPSIAHRGSKGDALRCVVVGHLREEKDPMCVIRAMAAMPRDVPIRVRHIGAPLDAGLAHAARTLAERDPRYRYSGALPHGLARAALARADLLLHPSIMEGGANVIVEAITAGTPVLASRMSGNVGMLGKDYPGFFPVGASAVLSEMLQSFAHRPRALQPLKAACARRKPLFSPAREARAVRALVARLLA